MSAGVCLQKRRNCQFQPVRIDIVGFLIDIDKHRCGPHQADDLGGSDEGKGAGKNGITGPHAFSQKRQKECVRARGAGDGMLDPHKGFQFIFQVCNFWPHDVFAMIQNIGYIGLNLLANALLLRAQIDKLHLYGSRVVKLFSGLVNELVNSEAREPFKILIGYLLIEL